MKVITRAIRFGVGVRRSKSYDGATSRAQDGLGNNLEFPVEAGGEDVDGAAVAVEGGVFDVLVIKGGVGVFAEGEVVVGLDELFDSVSEPAITGQDASAAGGEKVAVNA